MSNFSLNRLCSYYEDDQIVGTDSAIGYFCGIITKSKRGEESKYYVARSLWPAIDIVRTDLLLGLDKTSLRLDISFIMGH